MADCISSLPDEILGKILSLLPTKLAASTSILSKRWRNAVGLVDSLCFDESAVTYPNEEEEISGSHRFCDFVEKTFAALSESPIRKVSLSHAGARTDRDYDECYRWIWAAMERGFLSELYLHASPGYPVCLGKESLTSSTLVKLTLSRNYHLHIEHAFLPALKSLSLITVIGFDFPSYSNLLDGCPVLEELFLEDADIPFPTCYGEVVDSESIKRLVVYIDLPDSLFNPESVHFYAPSLVYLDYSSYVAPDYQVIDLDSLVEARLNLKLWESTSDYDSDDDDSDDDDYYDYESKEPIFGDVVRLVAGIANITTLHLSPNSLEVFHFCCETMPTFNNLLNLSVESSEEKGWQVMPLLLKSCPILHTLVIKGLLHRVTNRCGDACACIPKKRKKRRIVKEEEEEECCLWTCHAKILEVSECGSSLQELKQMRHFLGKLKCLENVKVGFNLDNNNSQLLRANLLAIPRVSQKCSIHFI